MATLQGKAVKNTYRQVLQIGANNVGVSGTLQPVQDGTGTNTSLSLSTTAATVTGDLTITGDLIITGGGIQIQDLIDDTVASLIQNGTGITWAYNDTLRTLTPTITIATADGGAQADYLQLNTGAGEASAVGKIYWNSTDGTAELGLMGGQVVLPLGEKQVARVLNNSGTIFTKAAYQVVKITAAQGQRLAVGLAQANNDANSTDTLGLVAENIANNQEGFITTSGLITGIDTTGDLQVEDWNDGDILYLSPTTPGAITKVKPVAPQHSVIVGFVVYSHKNNGKIYVKVDNGYELDELHNVRITSVADNNILQYNSSLGVWENVAGTTTNIAEGSNLYYTQARFDSAFAAKTTTNLSEGTNLYFTETRATNNFDTNLAASTTTDLAEGTNLYYTNTRARLALDVTAGTGISYNNGTGVFTLGSIPNASLTNSSITINSQAVSLGGSVTLTTTNIAEGTNLYWTDARFDSRFGTKTTTNLAEGTNLYYTQARFNTAFDAKTTTDLDEGTNLYYTDARARAAFSENAVGLDYSSGSGVLSLTSGYAIPTTVKLGEYDTAYNRSLTSAAVTGTSTKTLTLTKQDASTITASWTDQGITTINGTANQIATSTVGNTTTVGFTNDVTFPNNVVVSGNLTINGTATYVNTQSISSKDPLFEVANDNNTTDAVDIGYYGRYYDSAQTRVEFTGLFRDASDAGKYKIFSGLTVEPTNVVDTTGTGYTVGTLVANVEGNLAGTANSANVLSTARSISATGDASWTVNFDGSANATAALTLANTGVTASTYGTTTSVPTIAIDSKGRITSASNTNIAFPVTSVNGASGTVVLTTSNIAEGTNQYFTSARAQAAISGTAPISVASGVVSISQSSSISNGYLSSTDWNTFNDKLPAAGSTSITTLGTITTGVWNGTAIAIANGGTGSTTQNFVDLTTNQSIGGTKTFTSNVAIRPTSGYNAYFQTSGTSVRINYLNDALSANVGAAFRATDYSFQDGSGSSVLTIASTGAATFSSTISTKGGLTIVRSNTTESSVINNEGNLIYNARDNFNHVFQGNGTELMRISSAGNVGIGTTSPSAKLDMVVANSATDIFTINASNATNASLELYLKTDVTTLNAGGTGNFVFANGNKVERMRITSGGNVGIGTSTPNLTTTNRTVLDINGTSTSLIALSSGGTYKSYIFNDGTDITYYSTGSTYINSSSSTIFKISGTVEAMRITSGGNVGIGTSSPSGKFVVVGANANTFLNIDNVGGGEIYIGSNSFQSFQTAGTERMRITSGGDLGVGTSTINYATTGRKVVEINGSSTSLLAFKINDVPKSYFFQTGTDFIITNLAAAGGAFVLENNGSERFRIFASGNIRFSSQVYGNTVASPRTLYIASDGELGGISSIRASKTNIKQLDSNWLMQLNPVSFNYRKKDEDGNYTNEYYDELFYGLIAEETELVNKEICTYNDGKLVGIEYSKLVPVLVKAIQELKAEIDELKAK